jgi:hypothetical protein
VTKQSFINSSFDDHDLDQGMLRGKITEENNKDPGPEIGEE